MGKKSQYWLKYCHLFVPDSLLVHSCAVGCWPRHFAAIYSPHCIFTMLVCRWFGIDARLWLPEISCSQAKTRYLFIYHRSHLHRFLQIDQKPQLPGLNNDLQFLCSLFRPYPWLYSSIRLGLHPLCSQHVPQRQNFIWAQKGLGAVQIAKLYVTSQNIFILRCKFHVVCCYSISYGCFSVAGTS